ncbi:MAG TPA: putative Ig domain-containing protein [Silvibacterium sp.]|nr:putative Ig domain-containing protein [Silvibacterium sp.]
MISTPIDILVYNKSWTQIPSTVTLSIGSQAALGGAGILGYGQLANVCAIVGPASIGVNSPVPVGQVLQGGIVGTAYSETISAQGGTSPFTFALQSGSSLPAGLSLSSAGVISGTPTAAGTTTFTVVVTDANGNSGTQAFTIIVAAASSGGGANICIVN